MDVVTTPRQEVAGSQTSPMTCKRRMGESGQSLIEFSLLLPVLCLLSIGIVEIGRAAAYTIAVNNAATAGVEYGSQNEAAAQNTNQIISSATQDASLPLISNLTMTVTPTYGCTCDTGTGASCTYPVPAPASCTDIACGEGVIVECVQVETTATWDSLFHYPGLPRSYQANGKAVMRVRR